MEYYVEKKPDTGLDRKIKICSTTDAFNLEEVQAIKDAMQEHLLFIGLDSRNNVRKIKLLSIGTSCNTLIDSKSIIRNAILSGSDKVILVHNHPSNSLEPSKEDEYMTSVVSKLLKTFNIQLTDHIIVTEESYISMEKLKLIDKKYANKEFELLDKAFLTEENMKLKKENEELRNLNIREEKNMNKYESVIIMKPTLTEDEKNEELKHYKELFEGFSNKPVKVEDLGTKRLAYEIQGNKEGSYAIFYFNAKTEDISEIERQYRIDDNVMKFITVRQEQELEDNNECMDDEDMEM